MERQDELLMPIKEEFAIAILAGWKRYEIRKRWFGFPPGTQIWLYATKTSRGGTGAVLGSFIAGDCLPIEGARELRAFAKESAVTQRGLRAYLGGYRGWAIKVASYQELKEPLATTQPLRMYRRLTNSSGDRKLRRLLDAADKYQQRQPISATALASRSTRSAAR